MSCLRSQRFKNDKKGSPVHQSPTIHGVQGMTGSHGSIVCNLTLHFCKRLFPLIKPVTPLSHVKTTLPVTSELSSPSHKLVQKE